MKRSPLKRKTPLKPGTKRLKAVGVTTKRWKPWREHEREAVVERAGAEWINGFITGRCENCSEWSSTLACHHTVGRGGKVEEPWASTRWLMILLCPECHAEAHDGIEVRDAMRDEAYMRLWHALLAPMHHISLETPDPLLAIRELVLHLSLSGMDPRVVVGFSG